MHLLLTDRLTCPKCGPAFGLILLAHDITDRRVLSGEVGCSNCRSHFPIDQGAGDLRWPSALEPTGVRPDADAQTSALDAAAWAALLQIHEGSGFVGLAGSATVLAGELASLAAGFEFVTLTPALVPGDEELQVSRMAVRPDRLPFHDSALFAVALDCAQQAMLPELLRAVRAEGRIVVQGPDATTRDGLSAMGCTIHLDDPRAVVATKGSRLIPLRR